MTPKNPRASMASAIWNTQPKVQPVAAPAVRITPPPEQELPLRVEAEGAIDVRDWAREHQEEIAGWLREHGACLLRGFTMASPEAFGDASDAMAGARIAYTNRASPRTTVGDRIYTSTDYPHHLPIFPHNEHGYSPVFPLLLFFGCFRAADAGGATPIGSTRRIGASIAPAIRARFREKRVLYVRNYHEGFGVPWQRAFNTTDKAQVERACAALNVQCEWRDKDVLRTRRVGPAEVTHPRTGETLWFNHATFYHVSTLPADIRDALLADFDEDELPNQTYYGDGSAIEAEVVAQLREAYQRHMHRFDWHAGDLLALDNMLAVHAREPFTGTRQVLVSMAEEIRVP